MKYSAMLDTTSVFLRRPATPTPAGPLPLARSGAAAATAGLGL